MTIGHKLLWCILDSLNLVFSDEEDCSLEASEGVAGKWFILVFTLIKKCTRQI